MRSNPSRIGAFAALVAGALFFGACQDTGPTPADNTKKNERDTPARKIEPTPMDQGQSSADVDITASIRRDLVANDALSMNAKNVKVITKEGVVTLRGPVANEDERTTVVDTVQKVSGVKTVDNQLEIAR